MTTTAHHTLADELEAAATTLRGIQATELADLAELAQRAAEALRIPAEVHLVGIAATERDYCDMDSDGSPQQVRAAFADADEAQRWADRHNATVPWNPETKTVVLAAVPYVAAGEPGPAPAAEA